MEIEAVASINGAVAPPTEPALIGG